MFSPDSSLRLLNMRMDSELRNTLWFPDRNTQTNWFLSQTDFISFTDYSYVKKDNTIVLACREEDIWRFNYVMYQNTNFSNKWFYAFIVKREWASDYSTRIYLKTDPLQTWMFDWSLMTSFIERQHSTTDTPGDNIIPEPIGGSQTIYQASGTVDCTPDWIAVFATSTSGGEPTTGSKIGGMFSGAQNVFLDQVLPTTLLNNYVKQGMATAVSRIQQITGFGTTSGSATGFNASYSKHPTSIAGYTPRNKKLLSGAFIIGYITGFGQEVKFTPDFCSGDNVNVNFAQDITSGSVYCYVSNYGQNGTNGHTNVLGFLFTYPESTWAYNQYKNDYNLHNGSNSIYRERAKVQQNLNMLNSIAGAAQGVAGLIGNVQSAFNPVDDVFGAQNTIGGSIQGGIGNLASAVNNVVGAKSIASGIDEISQNLAYIDESYNAPATGNVAQSNPFIAAGETIVRYGWLVPDARIAERYDRFLDVYGYSQNTYAIPNLHARNAWTYVKVTELMLDANCPDEDELQIRQAFRNGIFWWVYNKEFGNFNQDNGIV